MINNQLKVSLENIIPLTEARDHFSQIVNEVQKDKLYVLTKGGKPAVAIVDVKYLEAITGGEVDKSRVEAEIQKAPEKVGLPPMVEHTPPPTPPTPKSPPPITPTPAPAPPPPPPAPPVQSSFKPNPNPAPENQNNSAPKPKPFESNAALPNSPTVNQNNIQNTQDKPVIETSFSNSDPFGTGKMQPPPNTNQSNQPVINVVDSNLDRDEKPDRTNPDDKPNMASDASSNEEPEDMVID